jgi:hypothetical protein
MTVLYDSGTMEIGGRRARVVVEAVYDGIMVSYDSLYTDDRPRWELYRDGNYPALPDDWEAPINEYMTKAADAWLHDLQGHTPDGVSHAAPPAQKEVTVAYGPADNRLQSVVRLNGVTADEPLTPKMARRASRIAHGFGHGAVVSDGVVSYRLYRHSARKLVDDEPEDYRFFQTGAGETKDRIAQVDWIDQTALDMVDSAPTGVEVDAADLVDYWTSQPSWCQPSWFDDRDRELLIERVAKHLTS